MSNYNRVVIYLQQEEVNGTKTYSQSTCLTSVFRDELKPLYTRLSKTELLQRCLKGIKQNQNQPLNVTLWSKCPKRVFCVRRKLVSGTALSVIPWNRGTAGIGNILTALGISTIGINTNMGFLRGNIQHVSSAAVKLKCFSKAWTVSTTGVEEINHLSAAFRVYTVPEKIAKNRKLSPDTHSMISLENEPLLRFD